MREKNFQLIAKTIEYISAIALVVFSGTSIYDVWIKYQSNDTSIKVSTTISENLTMPTVTLCFLPFAKRSVLENYNLTMSQYKYEYSYGIKEGLPWPEIYLKASYRIGIDFNISLALNNFNQQFTIFDTILTQEVARYVEIKAVHTIWMGICYRIDYKTPTKRNWPWQIEIDFHKSFKENELPKIEATFTSKNNAQGVTDMNWVEGKKYALNSNPNEMMVYSIDFHPIKYQRLKGVNYCCEESFYKCQAERYEYHLLIT